MIKKSAVEINSTTEVLEAGSSLESPERHERVEARLVVENWVESCGKAILEGRLIRTIWADGHRAQVFSRAAGEYSSGLEGLHASGIAAGEWRLLRLTVW